MAQKSRRTRWDEAVATANEGISALVELVSEYQDWRDNLPENLDDSPVAEKLDSVIDLGVDELETIINECAEADLPLGFGRD